MAIPCSKTSRGKSAAGHSSSAHFINEKVCLFEYTDLKSGKKSRHDFSATAFGSLSV